MSAVGRSFTEADVVGRRKTAQGHTVKLWADGSLTWTLNQYVEGSPHPRSPQHVEVALRAGWLVLGDLELYEDDEVPSLVAAARWAAERGLGPAEMRQHLHQDPVLHPVWTVLESDRDGRPKIRVWRLPRMRWPGLAVWLDRGTYTICQHVGGDAYQTTGMTFKNLRDLSTFLLQSQEPRWH